MVPARPASRHPALIQPPGLFREIVSRLQEPGELRRRDLPGTELEQQDRGVIQVVHAVALGIG